MPKPITAFSNSLEIQHAHDELIGHKSKSPDSEQVIKICDIGLRAIQTLVESQRSDKHIIIRAESDAQIYARMARRMADLAMQYDKAYLPIYKLAIKLRFLTFFHKTLKDCAIIRKEVMLTGNKILYPHLAIEEDEEDTKLI